MSFDKELISFATTFSKKYKKLPAGLYGSVNGKYKIQLMNVIKDSHTGKEINSAGRIGHTSGLIQLGKKKIDSPAFCFFLILWCVAMRKYINKNKHSFNPENEGCKYADRITIKYLKSQNKRIKGVIKSILKMFKGADIPLNRERAKLLMSYLEKK